MTLVELMLASAVMALMATTMAALATTVQMANEQQMGRGAAIQHGQVVIERIERTLQSATANENFPGFIVLSKSVRGATFPDTLVVWSPAGAPVAPEGMPRVNELVIFAPASGNTTQLVEIRNTGGSSEVPALTNSADWENLIETLQMAVFYDGNSGVAVLTDLVRVAKVEDSSNHSVARRACIRFEQALRPSDAEWQSYQASSTTWSNLPWAQSIYGATVGQRQALCRIELQLRPEDLDSHDKQIAIPFFGSGAVYYQLER